MKIILLQDVKKIGRRYEVKEVSEGYVRNFLLPRKLAKIADQKALQEVENIKKETTRVLEKEKEKINLCAVKLKDSPLLFQRKADSKGHVFESVKASEIQSEIGRICELNRLPEVDLEKPLKEIGIHKVNANFQDKQIQVLIELRQQP